MGKEREWMVYGSSFTAYLDDWERAGYSKRELVRTIQRMPVITAIDLFSGPEAMNNFYKKYARHNFAAGFTLSNQPHETPRENIYHIVADLYNPLEWQTNPILTGEYDMVMCRGVGPISEPEYANRRLDAYMEKSMGLIKPGGGMGMLQFPLHTPQSFFQIMGHFYNAEITALPVDFSEVRKAGLAVLVRR